jgi:hypothetical protein
MFLLCEADSEHTFDIDKGDGRRRVQDEHGRHEALVNHY